MLAMTVAAGLGAVAVGQEAAQRRVVKIVGEGHKLVLFSDGKVEGWGRFGDGQLGPVAGIKPIRYSSSHLVPIELPGKAIDIAAGATTSFAVLEDGTAMSWGDAREALLGLGTKPAGFVERPTRIPGLSGVAAIAPGVALLRDGTVRAWGPASYAGDGRAPKRYGEPGAPILSPVMVPGLRDVTAIAVGSAHILALTRAGRVYSWGSNYYGALGRSPRQELALDTPEEIPGLADVAMVAAGLGVSTAVKKDGTVWVWGANWHSQFGFGERTDPPGPDHGYVLQPQQVPGVAGVVAISLGLTGRHTLALRKDGTLRVWGNNDWGQLGTGLPPGFQETPAALKFAGVAAAFAAGNNSYAVKTDGTLWGWGGGGADEWPLLKNTRAPAALRLW
jgi:alpha-tubulin suppressor-like RCC1 family protein